MSTDDDRAVARRLSAVPPTIGYTRDDIRAVLRDWARHNPPRRFALYESIQDAAGWDGRVFAWGLEFCNCLVVRSTDERLHARFSSVASMLRYTGRVTDVGIVWIDAEG